MTVREINGSDQLFPQQESDETPVFLKQSEARSIARALAYVNTNLAGELQRIIHSEESEYLKEAAVKSYNSDTEAFTKLHVDLATIFPELRQH